VRRLVEQNALVSSIVDAVPVSMFVLDPDLRFQWANRALLDQLQEPYCSQGVVGATLTEVIPSLAELGASEKLRRVSKRGGRTLPKEETVRHTRGDVLHVVWQAVSLVGDKPTPPYDILLITSDITDRRRAEHGLRESEERFRSLYDGSPDAVLLTRSDGSVHSANAAARQLFQLPEKMVPETTISALVVADDRLTAARMEHNHHGHSTGELTFRRGDGATFEGEFSSHSFLSADGRQETSLFVRDITERKRTEEAARRAAESNAFRVALDDALREATDPEEIRVAAAHLLRQLFGGAEATYREILEETGIPASTEYADGRVRSRLSLPLFKGGHPVAELSVCAPQPRLWSETDMALIAETAERIWQAIERARAEKALRESEERFRTMFERHTAVMLLLDPETGAIVDGNTAAVEFYGYSKEQLTRMRIEDINMLPEAEVAAGRREAFAGQHHKFVFPHRLADSQVRWVDVYSAPMDLHGTTLLFSVIHDITERKEAEDMTARQTRIVEGINRIFREALRAPTLHALGRQCLLVAEDMTGSAFGFIGEIRGDGLLYPIALTDPDMEGAAFSQSVGHRKLPTLLVGGEHPSSMLNGNQGFFTNTPAPSLFPQGLPAGHPTLACFLGVPLQEGGRMMGMLALANRPGGYGQEDLETVTALAPAISDALSRKRAEEELRRSEERHLALAREKERLYEEQRTIAQKLQMAFIHVPARIGGLSVGHLYRSATEAARVGGDFYDVFSVREGSIAILLGDVAGHGIDAARAATLSKDAAHAFSHQSVRPEVVLRRVNELLVESLPEGFVTMFFGVLDLATGALRYGSAGHPQPLLRREAGGLDRLKLGELPLGVFSDATWTTSEATLKPGDLLFLYTDGLTEARRRGHLFGEEALAKALRRHRRSRTVDLPQNILNDVLQFSGGVLQDDVAILALKRN